jgi:hypothetical protein
VARGSKGPSLERIAEILVEATRGRDWQGTAAKHGISERTLYRWQARVATEPELAELVSRKAEQSSATWASEADAALFECVRFIRKAATTGDVENPDMVHSIAGAMKLLGELDTAKKFLQLRIDKARADVREPAAPGAPGASDRSPPGSGRAGEERPPVH